MERSKKMRSMYKILVLCLAVSSVLVDATYSAGQVGEAFFAAIKVVAHCTPCPWPHYAIGSYTGTTLVGLDRTFCSWPEDSV